MSVKLSLTAHIFLILAVSALILAAPADIVMAHDERGEAEVARDHWEMVVPSEQDTNPSPNSRDSQDWSAAVMVVNVELTDTGFRPAFVTIPAGQRVQLVIRNRGSREHHYHVLGLKPSALLWLSKQDVSHTPEDIHAAHHAGELVPYHICKGGVCPIGVSVHAHADPGDIDVIIFTVSNVGTFEVLCPLHPELTGKVVVF